MANTDLAKRCLRLKDEIDNAQIENARNKGRLDEIKKTIKGEYNVNTINKAKSTLENLRDSFEVAKKQVVEVIEVIEKEWELND